MPKQETLGVASQETFERSDIPKSVPCAFLPRAKASKPSRPFRIAYFLSQPIQYQSVTLRRIAEDPDIALKVFYALDTTEEGFFDQGLGLDVTWDIPLLEGYDHAFLPTVMPSRRCNSWRPINRGFRDIIKPDQYDLVWVHGWYRWQDIWAARLAKKNNIPLLIRTENCFMGSPLKPGPLQGLKEAIKHWMTRSADAIGYVGSANYDYFRAYRAPAEKLFFMPHVVDNALYRTLAEKAAPSRASLKQKLGLEEGRPVLLFVGKFMPRKGLMDLLEAYQGLSDDGKREPKPYLVIVGAGEQQEMAQARARETGWNSIIFAGFINQSELPAYYDLGDVFIIPSRDEQTPLVMNEAMNCGCAIVATDECGAAVDLVRNGVNGYIVSAGHIGNLRAALAAIISDPAKLDQMKAESRRLVDSFNADTVHAGLRQAIAHIRTQ